MANGEASTRAQLWSDFAAMVLALTGIFDVIAGIAALANKDNFATGSLTYNNLQFFGIGLLAIGVIGLACAYMVNQRYPSGRILGVFLALLGACWWFFFIDARPLWAIVAIAVYVLVIHGLMVSKDAFYKGD